MKKTPSVSADLEAAALREMVGARRAERIDAVVAGRLAGVVVVLENLRDPHNAGAALRSCEAVGLLEVRIVGGMLKKKFSERVTQGCEKWLELHRDRDIDACAETLKARGFKLYAAVPGATTILEALDPLQPAAFVVGNEHLGLTPRARELCDTEFAIPIAGFSQSLNLSVATALTVYTHTTRRRAALGAPTDLDAAQQTALRVRYYRKDVRRGADAIVDRFVARGGSG